MAEKRQKLPKFYVNLHHIHTFLLLDSLNSKSFVDVGLDRHHRAEKGQPSTEKLIKTLFGASLPSLGGFLNTCWVLFVFILLTQNLTQIGGGGGHPSAKKLIETVFGASSLPLAQSTSLEEKSEGENLIGIIFDHPTPV